MDLPESKSADQRRSTEAADADAAAPLTTGADKGFRDWQRLGLKIAPMAKTSNRNTCAPATIIPASAPRRRRVNAKPSRWTPEQYLRPTG